MKEKSLRQAAISLNRFKRKAVNLSDEALVETTLLGNHLPLLVQPKVTGFDPVGWIAANRDFVNERLLQHGAVLFRNANLRDVPTFECFLKTLCGDLLEYRERSSPRNRVEGFIYTSTEYPANESIFLHNENSYQKTFPLKVAFFCVVAPERGGQTPLADVRRVYERIPVPVRQKFADRKVMYVRNFRDGLGLSWPTVFQTDNKAEVEEYCRRAGIEVEWRAGGGLRTRQVRPAIARHPRTGEMVWFNHATFFHVSTLPLSVRECLLRDFGEEDLPNNTYYGDGSPIEPATLDELRQIYAGETVAFEWRKGDLLLLENMLVAHGRSPFQGERKIVVGMAESYKLEANA